MVIGMAGIVQLGGAAIGAIASGGGGGGGGGQTQTVNRDPWAPAQPYMLENLEDSKKLQDFYRKNPFNEQQKTSYQNTFGDIDNYRQNVAPGLMNFANNAMTGSYTRQRGGAPGSRSNYGGPVQSGGLLQSAQPGPFNAPRGQSYGLVDFNAQNPHTSGAILQAAAPVAAAPPPNQAQSQVDEMYQAYLRQQEAQNGR